MKLNARTYIIFCINIFLICTHAWGAQWEYLEKDDAFYRAYDTVSLHRLPNGLVKVWIRESAINNKGRLRMIQKREGSGRFVEGYQFYKNSRTLVQINCVTDEMTVLEINDYDNAGNLLDSLRFEPEWHAIEYDSLGKILYKKVCSEKSD